MKEGREKDIDFKKFVHDTFGNHELDIIKTAHSEKSVRHTIRILIVFVFILFIVSVFNPSFFCVGFVVAALLGVVLFKPLFDPSNIFDRSRIYIFEKGIVFPDLSRPWSRNLLPPRYAFEFTEVRKLQILKEKIVFHLKDEVVEIPREQVPEYSRLKKSLSKAYLRLMEWELVEQTRPFDGKLRPYLNLAKDYGFMLEWDMLRFKKEIDNLYKKDNIEVSLRKFLAHPIKSLEDLLVTSFIYGFFADDHSTLEEIVGGATDCLLQDRVKTILAEDMAKDTGGKRKEGFVRIVEELNNMDPVFGSPREVVKRINSRLVGYGLVFLMRGRVEGQTSDVSEFLLMREREADRIITQGKLTFHWI